MSRKYRTIITACEQATIITIIMNNNSGRPRRLTYTFVMREPNAIQKESFRIIEENLGSHSFSKEEFVIVRRVIHATADFDFAKNLIFHPNAISSGLAALRAGRPVFTDTEMVRVGINKAGLDGKLECFISDPEIIEEALALGVTRAILAMRKALKDISGAVVVIGNAPTALFEVVDHVNKGVARPNLIIGTPVGFVSTVEAKEELIKLNQVPWIVAKGRKGGSAVAVSIVNALLELLDGIS